MNAKLNTPSKSYKNTNEFLYFCCFSADLVVRAVLKMSATLLKYHTFEGGFHGAKKYKIRVHVHLVFARKQLINIKARNGQFWP